MKTKTIVKGTLLFVLVSLMALSGINLIQQLFDENDLLIFLIAGGLLLILVGIGFFPYSKVIKYFMK